MYFPVGAMLQVAKYEIACNIYWYWCLVALLEHEDGTWIAPMQEMKNLLCGHRKHIGGEGTALVQRMKSLLHCYFTDKLLLVSGRWHPAVVTISTSLILTWMAIGMRNFHKGWTKAC